MRNSFVTLSTIADPDSFISEVGSDIVIEYQPIEVNGVIHLEKSGQYSQSEMINAAKETCDMSYIMSRLRAGDDSVLNVTQGFYGDFSGLSYNPAEVLNNLTQARQAFDHLSAAQREQFNNDFNTWFMSVRNDDFISKMAVSESSPPISAVPGVAGSADPVYQPDSSASSDANNGGIFV